MKNIWRFFVVIILSNLILGSIVCVSAQDDVIVGAYGETSTTDPDVISAATFAVKSASRKQHRAIALDSIKHAELQVVAGLNFRLDLKVTSRGKSQDVTAVVYRDLRNNYSLSSWVIDTPKSASPDYRISAIKAMLFYDGKGTFSRDVLAGPDFGFWNTIIGEGDAEGPSNSTLVMVEVSGNPSRNEALPSRKVELTATAGGRVLLKRTSEIGLFSDEGKYYSAFWLYDTGCQPVKLSARIAGQGQASSMSKTIPFKCGE